MMSLIGRFYARRRPAVGAIIGTLVLVLATLIATPKFSFADDSGLDDARADGAATTDFVLAPGDAVTTGFSGITQSDAPLPIDANPLDHFVIDLDGPAAQFLSLRGLGAGPEGQRVVPIITRQIPARRIGQVFAITVDTAEPPNTYLGATSHYGLQIVGPDADGNGAPDRLRRGAEGARFMPGQFGEELGGGPGTIWKIDGRTGEASVFATLPENAAPGIGDLAWDARSRSLYASDLETGLIQRITADGTLAETFDHGLEGRIAGGLDPVADRGARAEITNEAFIASDPTTWGMTQPRRRVQGIAVHANRLFYAVEGDQRVWSIALARDGGFRGEARPELDVAATLPATAASEQKAEPGPITDIAFDADGRMYLARRGAARGSYSYAEFAAPGRSGVMRFAAESPDDPATPSRWTAVAETYAIGLPDPYLASNGGVALGYGYGEDGALDFTARDSMLWASGERLAPGRPFGEADENDLHGLQGKDVTLVRPQNVPPRASYFSDYDGLFGDASKAGHTGDVEIWQPAARVARRAPKRRPRKIAPTPPPEGPTDKLPPRPAYRTNLALTKSAGKKCYAVGGAYRCDYEVRVTNRSASRPYAGDLRVVDNVLALPAGALIRVPEHGVSWTCGFISTPDTFACRRSVFLAAGASVAFNVSIDIPAAAAACTLTNTAHVVEAPGGSWRNSRLTDDSAAATAFVDKPGCDAPVGPTNISIEKAADPAGCVRIAGDAVCGFRTTIENRGTRAFEGALVVDEEHGPASESVPSALAEWSCAPSANGQRCTHTAAPLRLPPSGRAVLFSWVRTPIAITKAYGCAVSSSARIVTPVDPDTANTDPADDTAMATAVVPASVCDHTTGDLQIKLSPAAAVCSALGGGVACDWSAELVNAAAAPFAGPVTLRARLPAAALGGVPSAPWVCANGADGLTCSHPAARLGAGETLPLTFSTHFDAADLESDRCRVSASIAIAEPAAGTFGNASALGDQASAFIKVGGGGLICPTRTITPTPLPVTPRPVRPEKPIAGPRCRSGWSTFTSRSAVPSDWRKYRARRGGITIWCGRERRRVVEPAPQCRAGWTTFVRRADVPRGWDRYRAASGSQAVWCGRRKAAPPPVEGPKCRAGFTPFARRADVPRGYQSYRARKNGRNVWCGRPRVETGPTCRAGYRQYASRKAVPSGWQSYRASGRGLTIWCAKPGRVEGPTCRRGFTSFRTKGAVPRGWTSYRARRNGITVWCGRKPTDVVRPGPICRKGWLPFPVRKLVPKGWKSYVARRNGIRVFCARKDKTVRPGPRPKCRSGFKSFASKKAVPRGWSSYRASRSGITIWCGKPKRGGDHGKRPGHGSGPKCPRGFKQYASRKAVPRGFQSYSIAKNGRRIWCARPRASTRPVRPGRPEIGRPKKSKPKVRLKLNQKQKKKVKDLLKGIKLKKKQ
ncbi:MAG: hypothetical protein AAFQ42_00470 [Pseudomonadota bacterium]